MKLATNSTLFTEQVRKDFPLLSSTSNGQKIIYLDNSATSQKPAVVLGAMLDFYQHDNANVHRGIYRLSERATAAYEQARDITANFIGASSSEIIFTKGTTESLNLLAYSLTKNLQPGDEIVLSVMEHHSNLVPWLQRAKEKKLNIKYLPLTTEYQLDLVQAQELISVKTKIVSVTHMSNVLGTINDVQTLASLAHAVGAVMIVDAAQSVPHFPVNVKKLDCDFLAFSGHKMMGPTGIGVLYGKKHFLEALEPFQFGGGMIREVTFENATWTDSPWKFEAGTPPIVEAIGLAAAIQYLQLVGMENIAVHEKYLTAYALEKLATVPRLELIGPSQLDQRGGVISFILPGIHSHDISEILDREGICVRGGHHCAMPLMNQLGLAGVTRVSFALYNSTRDIDAVVAAIHNVQEIFQ